MRVYRTHLRAFFLTAFGLVSCSTDRPPTDAGLSTALHTAVDAERPSFAAADGERGHQVCQEAQRFYRQNGCQLAWSNDTRARAPFDSLRRAPHAADREGLQPSDFRIAELDAMPRNGLTPDQAITLDLRATYARLRYALDLTHGALDPEDLDPRWRATARSAGCATISSGAVSASTSSRSGSTRSKNGSVLDMRVLTAKKDRPTPALADQMTTVVFSPVACSSTGLDEADKLIDLVYFTAWEENGPLKTVPDVYGLDRRDDAAAKGQ